jgi:hypothetical protein
MPRERSRFRRPAQPSTGLAPDRRSGRPPCAPGRRSSPSSTASSRPLMQPGVWCGRSVTAARRCGHHPVGVNTRRRAARVVIRRTGLDPLDRLRPAWHLPARRPDGTSRVSHPRGWADIARPVAVKPRSWLESASRPHAPRERLRLHQAQRRAAPQAPPWYGDSEPRSLEAWRPRTRCRACAGLRDMSCRSAPGRGCDSSTW